jgi:hypothetical protein
VALGIWSRFQSLIFGGAIGAAASEAIAPALEPAKQKAWSNNQLRVLSPDAAAELVAEGAIPIKSAYDTGARQGFPPDKMDGLVHLALTAPGVPEALNLYRRRSFDGIADAEAVMQLRHAFAKAKIEKQYWPQLEQLAVTPLELPVLANLIVRGLVDPPFKLPYTPPAGVGNVQPFPQSTVDVTKEAEAAGYDLAHLFAQVAITGRPMGAVEAAEANFRGILTDDDYLRAILEGDTRGEWANAIRERARQIPSVTNYVEGLVRNWITEDEMNAGALRHGMTPEDAHLLFLTHGRPLSWHQVWIGLQRGGVYDGPTDAIDPAFLKALQESDIRPEWYNLAWAQRYNYPTAFVLRQLTSSGDITADDAEQVLKYEGWEPSFAHKAAQAWAPKGGASPAAVSPVVKSQQTAAITALRKTYVDGTYDKPTADSFLAALDHSVPERVAIFQLWDVMRGVAGTALDTSGFTPH